MGYVRTAGMSTAARRRRRRTVLVLLVLLLALGAVGAYAVAYFQGWLAPAPGTSDTAQATTAAPGPDEGLTPAGVRVNVYNASGVPGLAGRTAEALLERGFLVDAVANDPERARIPHAADIRHGEDTLEEAQLLAEQVPGAELVQDGRRIDEIDLVLGDAFEEFDTGEGEEDTEAPADGEDG